MASETRRPLAVVIDLTADQLKLSASELQRLIQRRLIGLDILPTNLTFRVNGQNVITVPFIGNVETTLARIRRVQVEPLR